LEDGNNAGGRTSRSRNSQPHSLPRVALATAAVINAAARLGHWLVPIVFITIGSVTVIESGVVGELLHGR
jgi:hypothetical protein